MTGGWRVSSWPLDRAKLLAGGHRTASVRIVRPPPGIGATAAAYASSQWRAASSQLDDTSRATTTRQHDYAGNDIKSNSKTKTDTKYVERSE